MKFYNKIDVKEEFRVLLEQAEFRWVALRAADLTKKCMYCFMRGGPQYQDNSSVCDKCMGTGHRYTDRIVKTYSYQTSRAFDRLTNIGVLSNNTEIYVFEGDAYPKNTDFVLELDSDETTRIPRQPFAITRMMKINDVQDLREIDGTIAYWRCFVTKYNFDRGQSII
jgi:hypothetical protein